MDSKDYIKEALTTLDPDQFFGNQVPMRSLNRAVSDVVNAAKYLDKCKQSLFFGVPGGFAFRETLATDPDCTGMASDETRTLMHGIIGTATQSGKLIEALLDNKINPTSLKEEAGVLLWYVCLIAHISGFTLEDAMDSWNG